VVHATGSHVTQSEGDNTGLSGVADGDQAAEIKVVRQGYAILLASLFNDTIVPQPLKSLVAQVDGIVSLGA
jgi:hypothetical protein